MRATAAHLGLRASASADNTPAAPVVGRRHKDLELYNAIISCSDEAREFPCKRLPLLSSSLLL